MKAGSILASESYSRKRAKECKKIVAAIFIAATFIVFFNTTEATAGVTVDGLPGWQASLAAQSLNAVYAGMPSGQRPDYQAEILKTVASRLFSGYLIETSLRGDDNIIVKFVSEGGSAPWSVEVRTPQLQDPPLEWFNSDVSHLREETLLLLQGVPLESLSWSDKALQEEIEKLPAKSFRAGLPRCCWRQRTTGRS